MKYDVEIHLQGTRICLAGLSEEHFADLNSKYESVKRAVGDHHSPIYKFHKPYPFVCTIDLRQVTAIYAERVNPLQHQETTSVVVEGPPLG